jgi:hypothetical protein
MIVVIQCAASKKPNAGHLRAADGKPVLFVARPDLAPPSDHLIYARPDDHDDAGVAWRDRLLSLNANPAGGQRDVLPAADLYENAVYGELARKVGRESLYILSAGWGLIPATFLTPTYDITFSTAAEDYKRRLSRDRYADFRMMAPHIEGPILFFGSKDYVPFFAGLTSNFAAERMVFHRSAVPPSAPGCRMVPFPTNTRTNWHYECARAFIAGRLLQADQ